MITIFTPIYNRANLINILYESLKHQTNNDFEWIIVNDGSTDDIDEVMNSIMKENDIISIYYFKQNNGGKHRAINKGLSHANGEWFFIVDSDDWLPEDSISICYKWINTIKDDQSFIGIGGVKAYSVEKIIGATFKQDYLDCKSTQRNKYNIMGDKAEIWKTELLKKFPFPEFENENFLSESTVWNSISLAGYKLRWINETIYYCEYLDGGLTRTRGNFFKNYQGFIKSISVDLQCKELPLRIKVKSLLICCVYAKKKKYGYRKLANQLGISIFKVAILGEIGNLFYKISGGKCK